MIKCLAIDDEPLALAQITSYIQKVPFLELVKACPDAFTAIDELGKEKIDLIFADINMPDLNGLDFVRTLPYKVLVVFITAYSEYALEGFRNNAIDYLLKPIGFNDFLKTANKAKQIYELVKNQQIEKPDYFGNIFVKADYKTIRIEISEILYIESRSEYIRIYTEQNPPIMTLLSLKTMEEQLPSSHFMRVHRSYIVNLYKITEVSKAGIVFSNKSTVPIGDQYREQFSQFLSRHTLMKGGNN